VPGIGHGADLGGHDAGVIGEPGSVEGGLEQAPLAPVLAVLKGAHAVAEHLFDPVVEGAALVEGPVVEQHLPGQLGVTYQHGLGRANPDTHQVTGSG